MRINLRKRLYLIDCGVENAEAEAASSANKNFLLQLCSKNYHTNSLGRDLSVVIRLARLCEEHTCSRIDVAHTKLKGAVHVIEMYPTI